MSEVISFQNIEGTTGVLATQELRAALAICAGLANKEIAKLIGCAPGTVKKSVERVFFKLGVSSRSAVPTAMFRHGIARHLSVLLCVFIAGHAALSDDHCNRVRRHGERKVETRIAVRRAEAPPIAA